MAALYALVLGVVRHTLPHRQHCGIVLAAISSSLHWQLVTWCCRGVRWAAARFHCISCVCRLGGALSLECELGAKRRQLQLLSCAGNCGNMWMHLLPRTWLRHVCVLTGRLQQLLLHGELA